MRRSACAPPLLSQPLAIEGLAITYSVLVVLSLPAPSTCGVGGVLGGDGGISGGEGGVTSGGVNVFVNVVTVPSADFP